MRQTNEFRTKEPVAVLGTGMMGAPIARNLLAAGFPVTVWNRTRSRALPLIEAGAAFAESPLAAASGAGLVLTMLADGDAMILSPTFSPTGCRM